MGRKKKSPKASNDTQSPPTFPAELADLVLDLFDQLGFYGRDCPRTSLCFHVGKVRALVEQHNPQKEISQDSLLTIETWLTDTREAALNYLQSLEEERVEIQETCEELEDVADSEDLVGWRALSQHIRVEYKRQCELETTAIGELITCFDSFYEHLLQGPEEMIQTNGTPVLKSDLAKKGLIRIESVLRREYLRGTPVLRQASQPFESSSDSTDPSIPPSEQFSTVSPLQKEPETSEHLSIIQNHGNDVGSLISDFFENKLQQTFASALVIGQQGSGKSHLCDSMANKCSSMNVLRPRLPLDLLGSSAGEAEDRMISLFGSALSSNVKSTIIILDDVDVLITVPEAESTSSFVSKQGSLPHIAVRLQSTLMNMMDNIHLLLPKDRRVFLLCACTTNVARSIARFDHTIQLEEPTKMQRVHLIANHLGITKDDTQLGLVANGLVGRSFAEMSQLCRETVENLMTQEISRESPDWQKQSLRNLRRNIQKASPASLRSGVLEDSVDMTVYSAVDLGASSSLPFSLQLFGPDVEVAWKEIQSSIVVPLCRNVELAQLLNKNDPQSGKKSVCGGILLVGEPGSGKTAMAFEAARFAASLLPSLSLLDVSCTSLIHKEVGGSEAAVRRLFASTRRAAPCILVLDGIENIAAPRGNDTTTEGSLDRVLSTVLIEMDGIESDTPNGQGIAVIGISQDERWIDAALKRPGRLSKAVKLGRLDEKSRLQIIEREIPNSIRADGPSDVIMALTQATRGMAGASVVAVCKRVTMALSQGRELNTNLIKDVLEQ